MADPLHSALGTNSGPARNTWTGIFKAECQQVWASMNCLLSIELLLTPSANVVGAAPTSTGRKPNWGSKR